MKKLMRKLVLSSFALGLAVITLSTTTFAWYTSNTEVSADKVSSTTKASGDDLLMITQYTDATKSALKEWNTSISDVREDVSGDMVPLELVGNFDLQLFESDENATTGFIEFTLCFRNAGPTAKPLYIQSIELLNITGDATGAAPTLPTKDIIAAGRSAMGTWGANQANKIYKVDVLRTLMILTKTTSYELNTAKTDVEAKTPIYGKYNPDGIVNIKSGDNWVSGWNAHEYYNAVMTKPGESAPITSTAENVYESKAISTTAVEGSNKFTLGNVPAAGTDELAGQYLEVTFRVFINGWDLACFDACQEQEISINLTFTNSADASVLFVK